MPNSWESIMNDKEKLIYLAGIIDGEGSIMYTKTGYDKRRGKYYYKLVLRICNNDYRLIDWVQTNFPGKWYIEHKKWRGPNQADSYIMNLHCKHAGELLKKVEPYLILKQMHAKLARLITYYHSLLRGKPGLKDPLNPLREQFREMMMGLNYRGKNSTAIRKQWGELLETLFGKPKGNQQPSQMKPTLCSLEGSETNG